MTAIARVGGVSVDTRHWIGGMRVASADAFDDVSPIDGAVIARVARGGAAEADLAVQGAARAFPGWAATPASERARLLHAIAERVRGSPVHRAGRRLGVPRHPPAPPLVTLRR